MKLKIAAFAGVVYLISTLPEIAFKTMYELNEYNESRAAGILEIIIGICFVSLILFLFGLILGIPAVILEILLLYNLSESPRFKVDH